MEAVWVMLPKTPGFSSEVQAWAEKVYHTGVVTEKKEIMREWWRQNERHFQTGNYQAVQPGRIPSPASEWESIQVPPHGFVVQRRKTSLAPATLASTTPVVPAFTPSPPPAPAVTPLPLPVTSAGSATEATAIAAMATLLAAATALLLLRRRRKHSGG
jgi:LPXTG-motif cell wall-anchored protein